MNHKEAIAIARNFDLSLKSGDEKLIQGYSKADLKSALAHISTLNVPWMWCKEIEKRIAYLDTLEEERRKDKWWQRPLFVGVTSAVVAGLISVFGGYLFGVQQTVNNVPIQSNNRQFGNLYAHQIIFNESGQFQIMGSAIEQNSGSKIQFTAVSQDVAVVGSTPGEITQAFDKLNNQKR